MNSSVTIKSINHARMRRNSMFPHSVFLRIVPLLLVAILLLGGCRNNREEAASAAPTATPVPIPTATSTPVPQVETFSVPAMTRFDLQAVAGPEYRYPLVTRIPARTSVALIGRNRNGAWLQVDLNGASGWVAHWGLEYDSAQAGELPEVRAENPRPDDLRREVQPGTTPPIAFGYGLQAHMIGTNIERIVTATRDLEFNWLKQQVRWSTTEPEPGQFTWQELDLIVERATYGDVNLLFSVVTTPDWAREAGFDSGVDGPPADYGALASFMEALASRYCGTAVKAVEVWNEQNLHYEWGNLPLVAQDYINLLAPSSAAIRGACPSMYIVSGALTPAGDVPGKAVDDFSYLEQMMQAGVAQYVDAIGAHPSGYNVPALTDWQDACAAIVQSGNSFNGACDTPHHSWSFRSTMEGYRSISQNYGVDLPIWPTEFGWAAGGAYHDAYLYANDNDFNEQAEWTVQAFELMKSWGWVAPPILWNLNFRVIADQTERAQWGIVNNDWSPLPVYTALQEMPK